MRLGRMIATGTMAMGAYRAYKQYKGGGSQPNSRRSRFGGRSQQPQRGRFGSMLHRH